MQTKSKTMMKGLVGSQAFPLSRKTKGCATLVAEDVCVGGDIFLWPHLVCTPWCVA